MKHNIYLDANIIYGYFLAKHRKLKKKEEFAEPRVIEFLRENKEKFDYYVSVVTKAEIMRRLITELDMDKTMSTKLWNSFLEEMEVKELGIINQFSEVYGEIMKIVEGTKIKKRVTNLEHLIIAKFNGMIFVTGDKEILEKCKGYYPKIMSYIEFRRLI